jgi:hypothetical protein
MAEPMSDRELHERVADALAALRFYRTYFSSTGVGGDRFKEIVTTLYDDGKRRNEKFLMEMAVAIAKGYATGDASPLPVGFRPALDI